MRWIHTARPRRHPGDLYLAQHPIVQGSCLCCACSAAVQHEVHRCALTFFTMYRMSSMSRWMVPRLTRRSSPPSTGRCAKKVGTPAAAAAGDGPYLVFGYRVEATRVMRSPEGPMHTEHQLKIQQDVGQSMPLTQMQYQSLSHDETCHGQRANQRCSPFGSTSWLSTAWQPVVLPAASLMGRSSQLPWKRDSRSCSSQVEQHTSATDRTWP
jgi:hypothetical protein